MQVRLLAKYNESSMNSTTAYREEMGQGTEVEKGVGLFRAG